MAVTLLDRALLGAQQRLGQPIKTELALVDASNTAPKPSCETRIASARDRSAARSASRTERPAAKMDDTGSSPSRAPPRYSRSTLSSSERAGCFRTRSMSDWRSRSKLLERQRGAQPGLQQLFERLRTHRMLGRVIVNLAQQHHRPPLHLLAQCRRGKVQVVRRCVAHADRAAKASGASHGSIERIKVIDRDRNSAMIA